MSPTNVISHRSSNRWSLVVAFVLVLIATTGLPSQAQQASDADPIEVRLLVYMVDLIEIDGANQTFFADVIIVARWQDSTLAGATASQAVSRASAWSPNLVVVNQRGLSSSLDDVIVVDSEGNAQLSWRLTGDFSARMDLRDFPRDRQRFGVWVIAPPFGGRSVELVADSESLALRADAFSISDWTLGEMELIPRDYTATPNAVPITGLRLTFEASRKLGYYVIQVLLPLTAVVLMAWSVFWIDPGVVPTRIGVVVTTMLTLIAYRFMLSNLVPRLSYLTRLDYFMVWVTSVVIITLFAMAASNYFKVRERDVIVRRIDYVGRAGFPAVLLVLTLALWVF